MVYAVCYYPLSRHEEFKELGFDGMQDDDDGGGEGPWERMLVADVWFDDI